MATVRLGRTGSTVVVDLDVCVKTGRRTNGTVTLRGSTTPPWVLFVLVITVIGFLFVSVMTSRRFVVTVPYVHAVYDRWRRRRRLAWLAGLAGAAGLVLALVLVPYNRPLGPWVATAGVVMGVALVLGLVNGRRDGVGVVATRHDDLVITHVHPAFAAAVRESAVELLAR